MTYMRNSDRTKVNWNGCLNCGSYALDVDNWFHPYSNWDEDDGREEWDAWTYDERADDIEYYYTEGASFEEIYDHILEKDTAEILFQCPWVRQCDPRECDDGRRMIAYRIGIDWDYLEDYGCFEGDFHFRLRENDVWTEKNGAGQVHTVEFDDIYDTWECGSNTYDSPIIYFCFKEDDKK